MRAFIHRPTALLICLALALLTLALYWPVTKNGFVSYDDPDYITANPHVTSGLSLTNVVWAFKSGAASNWHPLTWISHMLDCQLFGVNPAEHHLVNLLFHIANTLLLFWWLLQATEWFEGRESRGSSVSRHPPPVTRHALWRSALVAALFAWHPLHVESVAWAAERKDVLSAFFWMLTLIAWTKHVRDGGRRERIRSPVSGHLSGFYFVALFFFACGLMSKPMVVTLPFVLLLLDWWPFGRIGAQGTAISTGTVIRLIIEKIPFFVLSAASCVVTFLVQKQEAIWKPSLGTQVENIFLAYVRYVAKVIWPSDLAVIYPLPRHWPLGPSIGAALLVLLGTLLALWCARKKPFLVVGWFWFLGVLVPTIGIVQVGSAAMADRYMYLPSIGLFLLVVWGLADLVQNRPRRMVALIAAAILALAGFSAATARQIRVWHDSLQLFSHAVAVTKNNFVAENALGKLHEDQGDEPQAYLCYSNSVAIEPRFPSAQFNLTACLYRLGRTNASFARLGQIEALRDPVLDYALAEFYFRHGAAAVSPPLLNDALALRPDFLEAHRLLGLTLSREGKFAEALPHLAAAARLSPRDPEARFNYGLSLLDNHQPAAAADEFRAELQMTPDETRAHYRLAQALTEEKRFDDAIAEYRVVLRLAPDFSQARSELQQLLEQHPDATNGAALDSEK